MRKPALSQVEPLESRIAPAVLVSPTTVQFTDTDGDFVTVKFSKPLFTGSAAAPTVLDLVFKFTGTSPVRAASSGGESTTPQQLQLIDLDELPRASSFVPYPAQGTDISITVERRGGGDGLTNVGFIDGGAIGTGIGVPLGNVSVQGDLGRIAAGDLFTQVGLKSLTVNSLGGAGTATQSLLTSPTLVSKIVGATGSILVRGDLKDAQLEVTNGAATSATSAPKGRVGSLTVLGSILVSNGSTTARAGSITVADSIGSLTIGSDLSDGVFGGGGANSGTIEASGFIGTIQVKGNIAGGAGTGSGTIRAGAGVGTAAIPGNILVTGSLVGGQGSDSGRIISGGDVGAVTVDGIRSDSVTGGANSGSLNVQGKLGRVTVLQDVLGGKGASSGSIIVSETLGSALIRGQLRGGDGARSGLVSASGAIGSVTVEGQTCGGIGNESGCIESGTFIGSVTLRQGLKAGTGIAAGIVFSAGAIGRVTLNDDLDGSTSGTGVDAGAVVARGNIGAVTIFGDLKGGTGAASGTVRSESDLVGPVLVTGSLIGGAGATSGSLTAEGRGGNLTIQGKLMGGSGDDSGAIVTGRNLLSPSGLGIVNVAQGLQGGIGSGSGAIQTAGSALSIVLGTRAPAPTATPSTLMAGSSGLFSGSIVAELGAGAVTIFGAVTGGSGDNSGTISGGGILGFRAGVTVWGSLTGGQGTGSGAIFSKDTTGFTTPLAGDLGAVTVHGTITGGSGIGSGTVSADGRIALLSAGAIASGSVDAGKGTLREFGEIGSISLTGERSSGLTSLLKGGITATGKIGAITIRASGAQSAVDIATIRSEVQVAGFTAFGAVNALTLTATGSAALPVAIGAVTVIGSVSNTQVIAGMDIAGIAVNGDASVGAVTVTGDFSASSIVAGVKDAGQPGFGDETVSGTINDTSRIAQIASVIVRGQVFGTASPTDDRFGFVAERIGVIRIGNSALPLTSGLDSFAIASVSTGDVFVREVA